MGSLTRKLKRHGCPNASERARTIGKIEAGLAMRGRELTLETRRNVLDSMAHKQAMAIDLQKQNERQAKADRDALPQIQERLANANEAAPSGGSEPG